MKRPHRSPFFCTLILILLAADQAWALQTHGPPEGIIVHQMSHLLFVLALGYLYLHTRKTPVIESRGWKYLQLFCGLLIAWNLLAFTGHEIFGGLTPEDFIDKGTWREQLAAPFSLAKTLYYITKMDHFLNVPALLALVVSLRTFYHEALKEERK
jgi:hypothetical protein